MFRFNKRYFQLSFLLFFVELYIAIYVHDDFIRPFFGDFLATIWLFCLISAFVKFNEIWIAVMVLLVSFLIEFLQFIQFLKFVGLEKNSFLSIVLGTSFAWEDILAYTLGIIFVLIVLEIKHGNIRKTQLNRERNLG